MVKALNEIAGSHGIGIDDMVESRVVGMKSREYTKTQQQVSYTSPWRNFNQ